MAAESLSSVQRALDVLRVLGSGPQGVQGVASALGREKTQVSRTLKVLADAGFVERDPSSLEYRIGWQVFALAGAAGGERLRQEAPGVLRQLVQSLREPAYLTVLSGASAVTVLTERPVRGLQAHEWIGRATPVNCTSSGRALLLGLGDDEVRGLLGDAAQAGSDGRLPGTEQAPRTLPALLERLSAERAAGYVLAAEEYEPGLVAVAAPVRDHRGTVTAALNVSAPVFRLPPEAVPGVIDEVTGAARQLTSALGGPA
ncbi:IclR family transcriptional regulator [Streptomyces sulphureus]|uniref:IclR family transcriptional regulator n=1 Tax=Streptomyces sulphureus TaxID=47758 RepID=UPI0003632AC3|nr:IclR family transcriptional regulator [Streptomyces sulphureus]